MTLKITQTTIMKKSIISIGFLILLIFAVDAKRKPTTENFYQFKAKTIEGKEISMKDYKGKVVLIVNTASKCGFTPQYEGLEKIYQKYKDKGFVILGFPCNQFGGQEPGSAEEIASFCSLKYNVNFPMFTKVEVNGENAIPLFKFLKGQLPGTLGNEIKWNFTKFLVSRDGRVLDRYAPTTKPEDLVKDIEKALA